MYIDRPTRGRHSRRAGVYSGNANTQPAIKAAIDNLDAYGVPVVKRDYD